MAVKTFAAIDVGSFEVSMKIFEVSKRHGMRQIDHIRRSIDMGSQTYGSGRLSAERVDELCNTLKEFKKLMNSYKVEEYKAYGTSALREAKTTDVLLDLIAQRTGILIEILSNSEQRFLDYKSVAFQGETFEKYIKKTAAILDIGGGSIQLSLFDDGVLYATQNMKLGVLRLMDRLATMKATLKQTSNLISELVDAQFNTYKKLYLKDVNVENIIIIDDYLSSILNNKQNKFGGRNIFDTTELRSMDSIIENMSATNIARRLAVPESHVLPIHISSLLLEKVMAITGAKKIWAPGVTLCDGIAYEYAQNNGIVAANHDFENDIRAFAIQIAKRYSGSKKRAQTLERIALNIFDTTREINGLLDRDRLLLQISSYLHDCGKYISMANLAECSYGIIKNSEIIGLSHKERLIVANVVKYNQTPFDYFEDFTDHQFMDMADHVKIAKLTAILRLANGLDRSHKMKFKDIKSLIKGNELILMVETNEDITLERGLFGLRAAFFEEIYNLKPVIVQKRSL